MVRVARNKKVLLLQGPMGPFFWHLKNDLKALGASVHKINFNPGDALFFPGPGAISFRGTMKEWPSFLKAKIEELNIDLIYLFGDCRDYHRIARGVAGEMGVDVFVFEEGYLRPSYITLEAGGVNANSAIPRDTGFYRSLPTPTSDSPLQLKHTFSRMAWFSTLYYVICNLLAWRYPHYQHHRPLSALQETGIWVRAFWRKHIFRRQEGALIQTLKNQFTKKYFLVPLQVHGDFQVKEHSSFDSVSSFIHEVISSFAQNAPKDQLLVIKHHPMDRGHLHYGPLIAALGQKYDISTRVHYIHDLRLPTLLRHARGVVVINSTVGLSALHHRAPLKVLGRANYDIPGLTFQGELDEFWQSPGSVDFDLYKKFRGFLVGNNQFAGSFYRKCGKTSAVWGIGELKERAYVRPGIVADHPDYGLDSMAADSSNR